MCDLIDKVTVDSSKWRDEGGSLSKKVDKMTAKFSFKTVQYGMYVCVDITAHSRIELGRISSMRCSLPSVKDGEQV